MPIFVAIEGLDGSGTTTQVRLLAESLRKNNLNVWTTSEPTDTHLGKIIREFLKSPTPETLEAMPYLFAADRASHVKTIQGFVEAGITCITDRYALSSYAYQSHTHTMELIHSLNGGFPAPDLTVFLRTPVAVCLERILSRRGLLNSNPGDYTETETSLTHAYDAYELNIAREMQEGKNYFILDGTLSETEIATQISRKVLSMITN